MKEWIIICLTSFLLLCVPIETQAQGIKNLAKGGKALFSTPSHVVRVRFPNQIKGGLVYLPIRATIFPYSQSLLIKKQRIRGYTEIDFPFTRPLQEKDSISFHLFPSVAPFQINNATNGIRIDRPNQYIKFFEFADNTVEFPFGIEKDSFSHELGNVNLFLSAKVNDDPYLTFYKDFSIKTSETSPRGRHEETLFEDSIELNKWKSRFEDFLKESKIELSFNTKLNNKVSQAFYSFCKRWEKLHYIDRVKGDASVRFLKGCGIACEAGNPRTYSAWFLKYWRIYKDNEKSKQKKEELLLNEEIDRKVEECFSLYELK